MMLAEVGDQQAALCQQQLACSCATSDTPRLGLGIGITLCARLDAGLLITGRRGQILRWARVRHRRFPLPLFLFFLFLGEISLTLLECVVGFSHL